MQFRCSIFSAEHDHPLLSSFATDVLASSFPCVLRAISVEIHDLEAELTLSQAG